MENEALDDQVRRVAAHLPFPVSLEEDLEADMGGTFTLQIELGRRGGPDDPPDRAGIDPGVGEVWWFDVEGGRESILSTFSADADPVDVARWITDEARRAGSPAVAKALADMGTNGPLRTVATTPTARPTRHPEGDPGVATEPSR